MFFKILTTDRYTILEAIFEIWNENNFYLQEYTHFNDGWKQEKNWLHNGGGVSYLNFAHLSAGVLILEKTQFKAH